MQLVAYGAQDIYLTGNPQITYFKSIYRRHTNFAIESIEQHFNGTADFSKTVTVTVARNGDLISSMYLRADLPAVGSTSISGFSWTEEVGHFLIKSITFEIGGQRIDRHYGIWLSIWNSLTLPKGHQDGYNVMMGNIVELVGDQITSASETSTFTTPLTTLYVPLQFSFNRHPGLALPLVALQYHEVKFHIEFEDFNKLISTEFSEGTFIPAVPQLGKTSLFIDYVFLDTDERRRFAQNSHEYLIEQLQYTGNESLGTLNNTIFLDFNHPIKELIWVIQSDDTTTGSSDILGVGNNYTDKPGSGRLHVNFAVDPDELSAVNPVKTGKIRINGHDRFSERKGKYFNYMLPYRHHSNIPALGINVYPFGLNPEDHQPSGTLNMSRIDNTTLQIELTNAALTNSNNVVKIFAINYNVLRIMSGLAGLAYSN